MTRLLKLLPALSLAAAAAGQVLVNGAGATFPYPIYTKWFDEFHRLRPEVEINYQSVGSGAGIRQLQAGVIDFAAADWPLGRSTAGVLLIPTVLGAVVPIYNLREVRGELNFTPEALAGLLLGRIRKWDDPALAAANPGVHLPDAEVVVVHRSEASGTTFIWTQFLSKTSVEWKNRVGAGISVPWPAGLGARGNEGVAGLVRQIPNAIGYVELVYALQNRLPYGRLRNRSGKFVKASARSMTAAAATVADQMPDDFRVSITDAAGHDAYPAASFTWLLMPSETGDRKKRQSLLDFLDWMLRDGQRLAEPLGYAPLPAPVVRKVAQVLAQMR